MSFTKTLSNSEAFASRYKKGWGFTCEALLTLLSQPPLPVREDDVIAEHDVEDMAFGVGFTQLSTIRLRQKDPFPDIGIDINGWVKTYLKEVDVKRNGQISSFAQERLSDQAKAGLAQYMSG